MEEDAQRALKEIKEYDGKKLSVTVAKKKLRDKQKAGLYKDAYPKLAIKILLVLYPWNNAASFLSQLKRLLQQQRKMRRELAA